MELRDKNGLTEAEFLAQYAQKDYPRPSFTADIAVFSVEQRVWRVLMVRRGGHPYLGCWALPGGFVNPDEDALGAARRELAEETGVKEVPLEHLGIYSAPGRDPRGWTVSSAYVAVIDPRTCVEAGDDAAAALWCPVQIRRDERGLCELAVDAAGEELTAAFAIQDGNIMPSATGVSEQHGFAFDHAQIVADAAIHLLGIA